MRFSLSYGTSSGYHTYGETEDQGGGNIHDGQDVRFSGTNQVDDGISDAGTYLLGGKLLQFLSGYCRVPLLGRYSNKLIL